MQAVLARLFDLALLRRLTPKHHALSKQLLPAVSAAADRGQLWVGVAAVLAAFGKRRGRRAALDGLAALATVSSLVNGPLKQLIRRPRPGRGLARMLIAERGRAPSTSSMPSGHAASAAAFTVAACAAMPEAGPPVAALACTVAWSRISAGRHYPTDVVAGIVTGAATGLAVHYLSKRFVPPTADETRSD
jgi:undecaprenyl-diphosphatase